MRVGGIHLAFAYNHGSCLITRGRLQSHNFRKRYNPVLFGGTIFGNSIANTIHVFYKQLGVANIFGTNVCCVVYRHCVTL